MKLTVLNRNDAIKYNPEDKAIIIRLDSQYPISKLNGSFLDTLVVPVEDFDYESEYTMTDQEAETIVKFIKKYENEIDEIVTHCHYKKGRSPAAILAIQEYFGQKDYSKNQFPGYNKIVYKKIKEQFENI